MSGTPGQAAYGHGHVIPRPDGVKARCGGPALCSVCAKEQAAIAAREPNAAPGLAVTETEGLGTAWRLLDETRNRLAIAGAERDDARERLERAQATLRDTAADNIRLREQVRLVREDRDSVRGRMLALAAALEDEAAASSYALESTPLAEAAARIRKGLDI